MKVSKPKHPFEYSWPVERLLASLEGQIAEGRIYGPIDRVINDVFLLRKPITEHGGWMLKPQPCLRECQAQVEPPELRGQGIDDMDGDTDDEEVGQVLEGDSVSYEDGPSNVSAGNTTIDSQHNRVKPGRRLAKRPDFAMAWATKSLTGDINHLYIEIKNGQATADRTFETQMKTYLTYAIDAIPPTMTYPVYFLLLNGDQTLVWKLTRDTDFRNDNSVVNRAKKWKTMGAKWWKLMEEIASRGH
ncbi:hypothetical protein FRC12_022249 [Ceratobasidium sp. 428]|nr:hypothetical protein FRC12_022249 [Ceratobasidium sp. 428]